jgi:hypothetical protein
MVRLPPAALGSIPDEPGPERLPSFYWTVMRGDDALHPPTQPVTPRSRVVLLHGWLQVRPVHRRSPLSFVTCAFTCGGTRTMRGEGVGYNVEVSSDRTRAMCSGGGAAANPRTGGVGRRLCRTTLAGSPPLTACGTLTVMMCC